jgi:hypothetical protein
MMRRAHRVDRTQAEIIEAYRCAGYAVWNTSALGDDFPDLVVSDRLETFVVECKAPGGKLKPGQARFRDTWPGKYFVIQSAEEALRSVNR